MALSDLAVFSEYVYSAYTEVLKQQIDLFNAASRGAIQMSLASNQGDYSDTAFWARVTGLVRRRNAYGTGSVTEKVMTQLTETMVKIAAGTPPIRLDPGMLKWIASSPEAAAASLGQQLAKDMLADMLNTSLAATKAALVTVGATVLYDGTGDTNPKLDFVKFNQGQALFGDSAGDIAAWVLHSKPYFDLVGNAIVNANQLFKYGDVAVMADPMGRPLIVSDVPALAVTGTPNTYFSLGLVPGAVTIEQNDNEYTDNYQTINGDENIKRTYQAEWTYNLGLKGFTWDKTNGGKSPNDAALVLGTNWDKIATSTKDLAGVAVKTQ